jgi:short-subunit dehydrogenase
MPTLKPIVLVTGASAGLGAALAAAFAERGHGVVLVARREAQLVEVADGIARRGHERPRVVALDLTLPDASERLARTLHDMGLEPEIVVNNAGFGLLGSAATLDRAEQLRMIDLNVRALTDLSLAFIESLERHQGGILNVASVAAFLPGPGMAVYYAGKAYVLSFSEALHHELKSKGVRVTVLCPGPVPTEFQARAGVTTDTFSPLLTRSAERVAREGYHGLKAGRRVVVPGFANKVVTSLVRFVPRPLLLKATDLHQQGRGR